MPFPVANCDICNAPIAALDDGLIAAYPFARHLRRLYWSLAGQPRRDDAVEAPDEGICTAMDAGEHGEIVRNVTRCYFYQFHDEYNEDVGGADGTSLRDYVTHERKRHDKLHRIKMVLSRPAPGRDLYMMVHEDCLPESLRDQVYRIDLERIDTAEKAIAWTLHLAEKTTWNTEGWMSMLASLFGRSAV